MYRYLKVPNVPLLYWRGKLGETEPRVPFYRGKGFRNPETGKRQMDWKPLDAETVKDAAFEIESLERSPLRKHRPTLSRRTTCDEALKDLLDFRASKAAPKKLKIEESTKTRWLSLWENHATALHALPVVKLTEQDLVDVLDDMRESGYFATKADKEAGITTDFSQRSLLAMQTVLDAFCEGMTWKRFGKLLSINIARQVSPEERLEEEENEPVSREKVILDSEMEAIIASMGHPTRWEGRVRRTLVALGRATGGRPSELLGLGVQQVNLRFGQIHFERQLRKGFSHNDPLTWFKPLKGSKGKLNSKVRIVTLSSGDWKMISDYIAWGRDLGILDDFGLLFPTRRKTPIAQQVLGEAWNNALVKAGITRAVTPHCLRHTFASKCFLERGATIAQVSSWLGHASEKTTRDVYVHIYDEELLAQQEREIMDRNLRPALRAV